MPRITPRSASKSETRSVAIRSALNRDPSASADRRLPTPAARYRRTIQIQRMKLSKNLQRSHVHDLYLVSHPGNQSFVLKFAKHPIDMRCAESDGIADALL